MRWHGARRLIACEAAALSKGTYLSAHLYQGPDPSVELLELADNEVAGEHRATTKRRASEAASRRLLAADHLVLVWSGIYGGSARPSMRTERDSLLEVGLQGANTTFCHLLPGDLILGLALHTIRRRCACGARLCHLVHSFDEVGVTDLLVGVALVSIVRIFLFKGTEDGVVVSIYI